MDFYLFKNMSKVYIVEAHFEEHDSNWWFTVGMFVNENDAKETFDKWNNFFGKYKDMFEEPDDFDNSKGDWIRSDEWYELKSKYGYISSFTHLNIEELEFNRDIFIENGRKYMSEPIVGLMVEWDRDYKLKNILE